MRGLGFFLLASASPFSHPLAAAPGERPGGPTEETAVIAPALPSPAADAGAPGEIAVEVRWEETVGRTGRATFSVALFGGFAPDLANAPRYQANLRHMGLGMLRYHNMRVLHCSKSDRWGWLDHANKTWDAGKIAEALAGTDGLGAERIINIPEWPDWIDPDGDRFLTGPQKDAFASLCAELVRIVRVEQGRRCGFEITNELDGPYWIAPRKEGKPDRIAELAEIYSRCARAMRAVDPGVKLGAPAATRGDMVEELREFLELADPKPDFLSYHTYASGDPAEPDSSIFSKTENMQRDALALRAMLRGSFPSHPIELHCNEFNISWTWKNKEPRMVNHAGAIFDALALARLASAGVDSISAWNDLDGVYGKMDNAFSLRPSAHVYHRMNRSMVGAIVAASSSRPGRVVPFAVRRDPGAGTLMLVNPGTAERAVKIGAGGAVPAGGSRLGPSGFQAEVAAGDLLAGDRLVIGPSEILWVDFAEIPSGPGLSRR